MRTHHARAPACVHGDGDDRLAAGTTSTRASGEQIVVEVADSDATSPQPLEENAEADPSAARPPTRAG